jgi:flagellar hook-associated protein 2
VSASISGLSSGLDTATIISQLIQLEAVQQNRLKTRVTATTTAKTTLQALNTKIAALATAAKDLARTSGWSPMSTSSSYDKVSLTTTTGAQPTQLSLTIGSTAVSHRLTFATTAATSAVVVSGGTTVSFDPLDGTGPVTLDTVDGTLGGLVKAVNDADLGVRASTIKLDDGTYRLMVESTKTGAAGDFTLTNGDGSDLLGGAVVRAGQDAAITIGADTIHSATNTFTNLLPGVSVTLGTGAVAGTVVDVAATADPAAMSDKVKSLVDSVNAILGDIDTATKAGSATAKGGPLAGDQVVRQVRDVLTSTLYASGGGSLADVGIQVDRSGKLVFDAATFKAAYTEDPAAVAAKFVDGATPGFMARVATAATRASSSTTGTITQALQGKDSLIKDLNSRIDAWDDRLAVREATLKRQFSALETALNQMQSQSSWLAGQIAGLPTSSG